MNEEIKERIANDPDSLFELIEFLGPALAKKIREENSLKFRAVRLKDDISRIFYGLKIANF